MSGCSLGSCNHPQPRLLCQGDTSSCTPSMRQCHHPVAHKRAGNRLQLQLRSFPRLGTMSGRGWSGSRRSHHQVVPPHSGPNMKLFHRRGLRMRIRIPMKLFDFWKNPPLIQQAACHPSRWRSPPRPGWRRTGRWTPRSPGRGLGIRPPPPRGRGTACRCPPRRWR